MVYKSRAIEPMLNYFHVIIFMVFLVQIYLFRICNFDAGSSFKKARQCDIYDFQWVGDMVIWNNCEQIEVNMVKNVKIGFVGDSLSRRLGFTLAKFLEGVTNHSLNEDAQPIHKSKHSYYIESNNVTIETFWKPLFESGYSNYDHDFVFVSQGLHNAKDNVSFNVTNMLYLINERPNFIFRTPPFPDNSSKINVKMFEEILRVGRDSSKRLLDTNLLMLDRSFGKNRIKGNTREHFGLQGRLVQAFLVIRFIVNSDAS